MRPPALTAFPAGTVAALRGMRVLVVGLGTKGGGAETVRWLVKHGAAVTVTDRKREGGLRVSLESLGGLPVRTVLGEHRLSDVGHSDLIIRNPAVPLTAPLLQRARALKIPIVMDTTLFFQFCPAPIAGVTGTRGKSTATAVAGAILRRGRPDAVVSGNIERSPLADLDHIKRATPVVLELSSWQLEGIAPLRKSPHWSVLTTILADHLDRYPSLEDYVAAKETIVRHQLSDDLAALPLDDAWGAKFAALTPAHKRYFGLAESPDFTVLRKTVKSGAKATGAERLGLLRVGNMVVRRQAGKAEAVLPWAELGGTGDHTKRNMMAGALLAIEMGAPLDDVRAILRQFRGLPHRLEVVRETLGRTFVNDTTATTPEAVVAALRSFPGKGIVLIAGGTDKNLDYRGLAANLAAAASVRAVVLLPGSATEKLSGELRKRSAARSPLPALADPVQTMGAAVQRAWESSRPGDLVLLSPGAASFELFRDEFDRGQQFRDAVTQLP